MIPRKKLTIVTPIFPPDIGGPASYVREVGQRLKRDFDLRIVGFCESKPVKMKNVEIAMLNPKRYGFFGRQWRLRRLLKKLAADSELLYIQGPVVVGANALLFAKKHKIPTVMKFVGDLAWEEASRRKKTGLALEDWHKENRPDFKAQLLKMLQKWSFKKVDRLVVPSQFLKHILISYYEVPESKIELVWNAFDGEQGPRRQMPERAYKLMTAGRLVPHKNVDLIIQALKQLPETYTLDIYGSGPEEVELKKTVWDQGLNDRIRFHGNVSNPQLLRALEESDLFVLYSSYEGLPHVVLEAFAARCPVVASDIPGTNEVALAGRTAVLAAPNHPDRLTEAIRNLSWDRTQREFLTNEAVRLLKSDFSWDAHLSKLKSIL